MKFSAIIARRIKNELPESKVIPTCDIRLLLLELEAHNARMEDNMSTPKHTPGKLNKSANVLLNDQGHQIAGVYERYAPGQQCANAQRLADCWNACEGINPAAVPDALRLLQEFVAEVKAHCYSPELEHMGPLVISAEAALKLAKGEK